MPSPHRGLWVASLSIVFCWMASPIDAGPPYAGRLLADVLEDFQEEGLDLVYTSAVVAPDLRVTIEPPAGSPQERLIRILDPLGLTLARGPEDSWLVVSRTTEPGVVRGRVVSATGGHRVPLAEVRISATSQRTLSDRNGLFELTGIAPGASTRLEVRATGFEPVSITTPLIEAGGSVFVVVELLFESSFLTEVRVTPGRHTIAGDEAPSKRTVTREDIQTAPASSGDVTRVVEFLPGVAAPDNSAGFLLRGSTQRDTSIVLDGLELYDPFHLNNFQSPYSLVDANAVNRVDVRAGGFTADLGDRMGGFIEITTVNPTTRGGELEIGSLNSRFTYRTPFAKRTGTVLLSGRAWYPDSVLDATELGGAENLQLSLQDLYAKASFSLSSRFVGSAHLLLARDRVDFVETGELVNERVEAGTDNVHAWVSLVGSWDNRITTNSMLSVGTIDKRRNGVATPDDEPLEVLDNRSVAFVGLRHDMDWKPRANQRVRAGIEVRLLRADYDYRLVEPGMSAPTRVFQSSPEGESFAGYATYRRTFSTKIATEVGLRWDRQSYTDDNKFSPRFNAAWRPNERTELRFAVGRFRQSQRIHELAVEDGETAFSSSEESDQIDLTFECDLGAGVRFRADAYYRRLSDLRPRYENLFEPIELFPETAIDRVVIAPDSARLRGLEVFLRSRPGDPLVWWTSYTLASAEDRIGGRDVPRAWDQKHAVKFLIGYRAEGLWSLSLSGVLRSGWPETPVSGELELQPDGSLEPVLIVGPRNTDRLPGYRRFDARFRRGFTTRRGGRVWLTLDVSNLTNRENFCCVADFVFDSGPPGPVDVVKLYDAYLGIRPAFSVLWEF